MESLWAFDRDSLELVAVVLIKLAIGAFLASIVGWERERHGRPAGIRTHMLVGIGVILFTECSRGFSGADASRVAAQIVTGIGFLGAGTIMRNGLEIKGLTTAASIWAVAGISMAVSLGGPYMLIAVIGTILTIITLAVVDNFERMIAPEQNASQLLLTLQPGVTIVSVLEAMDKEGIHLLKTEVCRTDPEVELSLKVKGNRNEILRLCTGIPGVRTATWKN